MPTDRDESTRRPGSSYRFLFSPKWLAFHLLVIALVVTMINLALWQLRRLDERRDFNAKVTANQNQPVTDIADVPLDDPSAVEWRRVRATGTYVQGHEFLVVNRSQNGENGRNVVDALQLDGGQLLLVNRGFVPVDDDVPPVPTRVVTIEGRLRTSEHRKTGQPSDANVPGLTEIHRIDVKLLSGQFDTNVFPMYVDQLQPEKPLEEIVGPTLDEGPHLSYTIQWFIFSACTVAGWVLAVRRSIAARSGKVAKKRKSAYIPIAEDESVR